MSVRILIGDVRSRLADLPDDSVHCVVTSPPYFGLRDYGTASWEGGDPACDHVEKNARNDVSAEDLARRAAQSSAGTGDGSKVKPMQFKGACNKCGAIRADKQIGLEDTPAAFVAVMVEVFREVRRVLRDDGTLFLNLGDSYNGSGPSGCAGKQYTNAGSQGTTVKAVPGLKPKDLIGIPWRVAFALQADGWYLRQDIIWAKPNPMPESVTDRCTKAHEYLFLLTKSAKYHYDAAAIAEDAIKGASGSRFDAGKTALHQLGRASDEPRVESTTRNRRSVWTVATQPFSEAHFATFPPALIEPCILAGCPKGGTVLDPFFGAGTTGLVADRHGRKCIGIELNPEYAAIADRRINADAGMFAKVAAE